MNTKLRDYFKELDCTYPPEIDERDGETFLRHRALCCECPGLDRCREHGWVMQILFNPDKSFARIAMGACRLRKIQMDRRKAEKLFSEAEIPLGLQRCQLANYVTAGRSESAKRAKFEAESAIRTSSSLVLAGRPGTGKTHLAAAIVQSVLAQGRSALFISAVGYLEHLKSTFETQQADLYPKMVSHVKSVTCLAIDDFGTEKPSEWAIERLYDVINTRIERNLQTIVTTNFANAPALIKRMPSDPLGAERIVSRLLSFGWLSIEGEDYRVLRRKRKMFQVSEKPVIINE
jgi:DNA replication protein DnaC